ncbi:MAG: hypothetical protein O2958_10315 [Gemmatimonadetes bacterium]|nr:hypothetical protein [Gemmatimonadota bacterium]MDA1103392.1 hypothetical protein [Gemmatimonadota bacterium]
MYRKLKPRDGSGIVDLDSLMDILSCLVGVMLFLVIYTVLELGSTTFEAVVPAVREAPFGSERVVVVADRGTVRVLDARGPIEALLSGFAIVEYDEAEAFVRESNQRIPSDTYFRYSLTFEDRLTAFGLPLGTLDLRIEAHEGVVGDSIHQLEEESTYLALLDRLNPETAWLAFAVDGESVEVFRRARDLAITRGFVTRFGPVSVDFPFVHRLSLGGAEVLLSPRSTRAKLDR